MWTRCKKVIMATTNRCMFKLWQIANFVLNANTVSVLARLFTFPYLVKEPTGVFGQNDWKDFFKDAYLQYTYKNQTFAGNRKKANYRRKLFQRRIFGRKLRTKKTKNATFNHFKDFNYFAFNIELDCSHPLKPKVLKYVSDYPTDNYIFQKQRTSRFLSRFRDCRWHINGSDNYQCP